MRVVLWAEDDALPPDRELLSQAGPRIFGKRGWDAIEKMAYRDEGDAFVKTVTIDIVSSYPGATGIYMETEGD